MATPSDKSVQYEKLAKTLGWTELSTLWEKVKRRETPDWDAGKALEYLVVRGFELSGMSVQYPFDVPSQGRPLEQIDGFAFLNELALLIECKDQETADVEVIAKVKHQLDRRPPTTIANVFVAGKFTEPAIILANLTAPQRVLL